MMRKLPTFLAGRLRAATLSMEWEKSRQDSARIPGQPNISKAETALERVEGIEPEYWERTTRGLRGGAGGQGGSS